MLKEIEKILDEFIRPRLFEHYGDVSVLNYKDGILKVKLKGQCSNCPSAKITVEDIIEKEIKEHISEVNQVVLIEGVSDELLDFAKIILNHKADSSIS